MASINPMNYVNKIIVAYKTGTQFCSTIYFFDLCRYDVRPAMLTPICSFFELSIL